MTTFVVMEPDGWPKGERTRFVPDRFVFTAFVFPVIWFLFHRLWIEALVALAATVTLAAFGTVAGLQGAAPLLSLLVSVYVALEGASLRIAGLERRGFRPVAIIEAGSRSEAELRYLNAPRGRDRAPLSASAARSVPSHAPSPDTPMLGLLDYPGTR